MNLTNAHSQGEHSLAVAVTDHWLDEFCEHVGSLGAILQVLSGLDDHRPHTLVAEAMYNCTLLQSLLNRIPVSGGHVSVHSQAEFHVATSNSSQSEVEEPSQSELSSCWVPLPQGDSFPEFEANLDEQLPDIDATRLEEHWGHDADRLHDALRRFRDRAEGDLRELQMLSVGHDWTRLSRLAGALKDAAALVSATRVVVDAAALQCAARGGCRNDVDVALDALKADLRACAKQVDEWPAPGVVG